MHLQSDEINQVLLDAFCTKAITRSLCSCKETRINLLIDLTFIEMRFVMVLGCICLKCIDTLERNLNIFLALVFNSDLFSVVPAQRAG